MSTERAAMPLRTVEEALRGDEPCEALIGYHQGFPFVFLHDPERPDRTQAALADFYGHERPRGILG